MELTQESLTNIILIILLIFPTYSFIRTLYITYNRELVGKLTVNLISFLVSFLLFIVLYQLLWLPNQNDAELADYIVKVATVLSFIPSIIVNFKTIASENKPKEGFTNDGK